MSDVFDEVASSFLVPGDLDDPKPRALQTKIDPLSSVIHNRLKALKREVTDEEGRRIGLQAEIEQDRENRDELLRRVGHLDLGLSRGHARSKKTDEQRSIWTTNISRYRASMQAKELAKSTGGPRSMYFQPVLDAIYETPGPFVVVEDPVIPDGETLIDRIKQNAAEITEQNAARVALLKTSPLIQEIKEKAERDVEWRASQGAPDTSLMFALTKRDLSERESYGSVKWPLNYEAGAFASRPVLHVEHMFFWLNKAEILKRLFAQIEEQYDPTNAMSSADRTAALAKVDARLGELDYEACGYVWLAKRAGMKAEFRYGSSPLAVIGLKVAGAT